MSVESFFGQCEGGLRLNRGPMTTRRITTVILKKRSHRRSGREKPDAATHASSPVTPTHHSRAHHSPPIMPGPIPIIPPPIIPQGLCWVLGVWAPGAWAFAAIAPPRIAAVVASTSTYFRISTSLMQTTTTLFNEPRVFEGQCAARLEACWPRRRDYEQASSTRCTHRTAYECSVNVDLPSNRCRAVLSLLGFRHRN